MHSEAYPWGHSSNPTPPSEQVCIFLKGCTLAISIAVSFTVLPTAASVSLTPEPDRASYHFVTHYRVNIDASPAAVWPVLVNLKSWMYEFDLTTISGEPGQAGHVLNLYAEQAFQVQVTHAIPNQVLTIANLPLTFRGEFGTGIGVMTLHETASGTELSLTMSRRYTWQSEAVNPLREMRATAAFHEQTRAMWEDRFLARLKSLAEGRSE